MKPTISVILPVYNQSSVYLSLAIESILNQTFSDFELIIIDDGSTQSECLTILEKYRLQDNRIKLITNISNLGLIESLNKALLISEGEFIARMDSDDIAFPKRLQMQLDFFEKNPIYTLIGANTIIIDQLGNTLGTKTGQNSDFSVRNSLLMTNGFTHATWMFRKDIILKIGKYSPSALRVEDYDLLLRLHPQYKIINLREPLLYHRINNEGISWSNNKKQELSSLKIRLKHYRTGRYPLWQITLLLPSFFLYLIPTTFKRNLLILIFKKTSL